MRLSSCRPLGSSRGSAAVAMLCLQSCRTWSTAGQSGGAVPDLPVASVRDGGPELGRREFGIGGWRAERDPTPLVAQDRAGGATGGRQAGIVPLHRGRAGAALAVRCDAFVMSL